MTKPEHTDYWEWKGRHYRFDIYLAGDFAGLPDIRQVYALVLSADKSQVLVVREGSGLWMLPGGTVEPGETLLQTLVREVREESNCDVALETARPLYYQKAYRQNGRGEWVFERTEVRFTVDLAVERAFIADPDRGTVVEARWVPIVNLETLLDWGETTRMIKRLISDPHS